MRDTQISRRTLVGWGALAALGVPLTGAGTAVLAQLRKEWTGRGWYARGYFGPQQIGKGVIFGEPQGWALLAGAPDAGQARTLVANVDLSDVSARSTDELAHAMRTLSEEESGLSAKRRQVQQVMDACGAEITRRYRDGEADVDTLLGQQPGPSGS